MSTDFEGTSVFYAAGLTGDAAGQRSILDTSVAGVFAVGDVRSGSVKRCATAVGEGAMVVRFVHERMTGVPA